tara:strand:- start:434 stop:904 length:471 start_codon:yes stop_codon:yes gene_type:complete
MSTLVTNTITGLSTAANITIGSTPVVSASANSLTVRGEGSAQTSVQQGLNKHWVNINGTGTIAARDSFNNSSITDVNTGTYQFTFTNNMGNDDYCAANIGKMNRGTDNNGGSGGVNTADGEADVLTSSFVVAYINVASQADVDVAYAGGHVKGDLA